MKNSIHCQIMLRNSNDVYFPIDTNSLKIRGPLRMIATNSTASAMYSHIRVLGYMIKQKKNQVDSVKANPIARYGHSSLKAIATLGAAFCILKTFRWHCVSIYYYFTLV